MVPALDSIQSQEFELEPKPEKSWPAKMLFRFGSCELKNRKSRSLGRTRRSGSATELLGRALVEPEGRALIELWSGSEVELWDWVRDRVRLRSLGSATELLYRVLVELWSSSEVVKSHGFGAPPIGPRCFSGFLVILK